MLHELAEATRGFLDLLDDAQRAAALRSMADDDLRTRWAYTPGPRPGACYGDLTRDQRKAVQRLLSCVLSPHAYAQVTAIMALEDVLDDREGGTRDRHQGDFWTVLLGEPGDEPWGWRIEGHHLSVNVVVAEGRVSATPLFLGAHPARVTYRGRTVSQPLRLEEELARELLDRMGRTARGLAVVADAPPADLRTGNARRVGEPDPVGVTPAQLDRSSRGLLVGLVRYYLDRLTGDLADEEFDALDLDRLHFAWEGSDKRGAGHYYRIQGPELLIEYDNTDNDANHAHTVWRRRSGDFGEDLLAAHRAAVSHG
ncbi:DUF3500 domain-containing protein [Actinosynnema sp. NPDC059335]|uniref:DUF3500 domain-containing protein n=1 Tax=Actinosynnema sp. NPDC059335 TaxID=3346804 RepID=UPI00366BF02A